MERAAAPAAPHNAIVHASGIRARAMYAARSNTLAARLRIPASLVAHTARGAQAELGWALHPGVQGRGFATEAVAAVRRLAGLTD